MTVKQQRDAPATPLPAAAWAREQWRKGRWVKLSWTQKERDAILRQDELYRQADANWELNHGPIPGGASVVPFHQKLVKPTVCQISKR